MAEYKSGLVLLLEANGATEEDCEGVDNIWREKRFRSGEYPIGGLAKFIDKRIDSSKIDFGPFSYDDCLFLLLLGKPRIIPHALQGKIKRFRNVGLTTPYLYSDGKVREGTTKGGWDYLDFAFHVMGLANQFKILRELKYLKPKMSK
ncbi:hypothetical protein JW949_03760 [Candidatus Woesearchaeota archaeon]|nr:hypothetical protein [Candidatus Woesearchaeota archaeon]